jgi:hypothetical protein
MRESIAVLVGHSPATKCLVVATVFHASIVYDGALSSLHIGLIFPLRA